jgi:uroporphyrinogen-III decarboxylase
MAEQMTSRQRLLAVLQRKLPDRVPVAPDVSMMMPCRYTGKPFWEVLLNENPPLWQAHIDLQRRFGYDAIVGAGLDIDRAAQGVTSETQVLTRDQERWVAEETTHTPKGDLTVRTVYFRNKSSWVEKPLITDPEDEIEALLATLTDPWDASVDHLEEVRAAVGESGIIAAGTPVPPAWWLYCRRDLSQSVLDFYDRRPLVERAMAAYGEWALDYVRATCALGHPDLLMFGGSVASMSVINPTLYRRYALPWLQKATAIARSYGVFTGVHMCGKSRAALPILAESGIDLLEPIESPPGGDIDLRELKREYGQRFVLKGNVNTFETLARGTPEDVVREARGVLGALAEGGGLILSSGDQVGGDTPEANFIALIDAVRRYGVYDPSGALAK